MVHTHPFLPERLETPRLILRPYHSEDAPAFFAVGQRNREHLARFEAGNIILQAASVEGAQSIIADLRQAWDAREAFFWGMFRKDGGELIGQVYVGIVDAGLPEYEIGYFVDWEHEGQGLVREAARAAREWIFTALHARRVRLECSDANLRSLRVAEALGFQREAHFRKNRREADGSFTGTLIYAMLREERQV